MSLQDRRNNEGYKNWLRVGLALLATRDGLTNVTLRAAKELHAALKAKLGDNVETCTCNPKKKEECKVFMPRGQSIANIGPETSDTSALLNFLVHCKCCNKYVSVKATQKVIEVRNRAMHSADLTFSQQAFHENMSALLNLMRDPTLGSDQAAKKAADEISKIQTEDFHISADKACHDAEVRVLTDLMEGYRKSLELHEKELGDHATRLDALEQGTVSVEKVPSKAINSILDMVNGNADLQSVLQGQASELSTILQQYLTRLGNVEGDVSNIKDEVNQLEKAMTNQKAQLDDVTTRVDDEISDMKVEIGDVRTSVDDVKEDLTKVKQKLLEAPPGSPKSTPGASISCKNTLQEYLDKEKLPKPKYVRIEGEGANAGQPPFTYKVGLQYKNALCRPEGGFASKKVAIQKACELALQRLGQSHLTKDPTHFRAELQEYLKKQSQDPDIEVIQDEQGFSAQVRMTGRAEFPQGDTSSTKKEAEQSAAEKALLALGLPLPILVHPRQTSPKHGANASNKVKDDRKTTSVVSRAAISEDNTDYKTVLKGHVKKQKLPAPFYKNQPEGEVFKSTVTFKTRGAYQTAEPAKGKKEAEQNAAKEVVRMLGISFRDTNYKGALQENVDLSDAPTYHTYKCQGGFVSVVRCKAIIEPCSFQVTTPEDPDEFPADVTRLPPGSTVNKVTAAEQRVAKFALDILGVSFEGTKQTTPMVTSLPETKGADISSAKAKTAKEDAKVPASTVAAALGIRCTISSQAPAKSLPDTEAKLTETDGPSSQVEVGREATASKDSVPYKDILQKHVQDQKLPSPRYKDVKGEENTLSTVSFKTRGAYQTKEPAKSKKEAEQNAAKAVLGMLKVKARDANYKGALQEYATKESSSGIPTYYTYRSQDGYISIVRCQAISEPCSFSLVTPDGDTAELQTEATTTSSLSQGDACEIARQNAAKFAVAVLGILQQPPTGQTAIADTVPEAKEPGKGEKDLGARAKTENSKGLKSATATTTTTTTTAAAAPGTEETGTPAGKASTSTAEPSVVNRTGSQRQDDAVERNYKAILQQHVQKQRLQLPPPKYHDSNTEEKTFQSTVRFETAGAYQTTEAAPSKKDSEQNAAKSVIDLLEHPSGNDSNYKGVLQQYATKLDSNDIPKYQTYSCEGGFKTVVICRAITKTASFEVNSEACNSKKEAQQRAARRAVELLDIPLQ